VLPVAVDQQIPVAEPALLGNEARYVADCVESGWVSSIGPYIERFERGFAAFADTSEAVACNSGTSALHLCLLALGVGPGDEVLLPTLTYVATANAVRYCGATPVFVDSDADTMTIDPSEAEARITPRTVGVIAVHLYGQPADMHSLTRLAARAGLWVIEDAAEAHGARHGGQVVGGIGTLGAFSFFGNKVITTGEGGMVTTDDPELADRVRLYRGQGQDPDRRYWFPVVGHNYRMTNVQAALGVAQLEQVGEQLQQRERVASWYREALRGRGELVRLPVVHTESEPVTWLFTVVLGDVVVARDELAARLAADGIETRPVFVPLHLLPPHGDGREHFPHAERLARNGLSLPTSARRSRDEVIYVAERLLAHLGAPASTAG
jgi:perosamine synthetase